MGNIQRFWKHLCERLNTSITWRDIKQEEIQKQPFMAISIYVRKFTEIDFMYDLFYEKFELMEFIENSMVSFIIFHQSWPGFESHLLQALIWFSVATGFELGPNPSFYNFRSKL